MRFGVLPVEEGPDGRNCDAARSEERRGARVHSGAPDDDQGVGRLPTTVANAVVGGEGTGSAGTDAHAEASQLVVPGDQGRVG